jgi:hypothetical protein
MAVTINASTSAGLINTADTSGILQLQTASTTAITIDASQAVTIQGLTIGRGAGAVATNTAVGASALNANTTGASGVAIGNGALQSNTTASNNTAVGYQAGYTNTTAGQSTYIGTAAGSLATGSGNTFVGCSSGETITTGSSNTILGRYNGNFGGLDIRTASNYIVLSDGAGTPLISTNSSSSVALKGAVPQTGTGITFPATQSASTNANTLDDYEEGTWTPTVVAITGTFTTVGSCSGKYVKIGQTVSVTYTVNVTTLGTGGAGFGVTNLPFTVGSATGDVAGYGVRANDGNQLVSIVSASSTRADTYLYTGGSPLVAGVNYRMCITYFTT